METGRMKLALSAGAVALSMALAGCGGSSSSGGATTAAAISTSNDDDDMTTPPMVDCGGDVMAATAAGCAAALEAANQANETAFEKAGGTPGALLIASGANAGYLNRAPAAANEATFRKLKDSDRIEGLHGSENPGMTWITALGAEKVELTIGADDASRTAENYALKVTGKATSDFALEPSLSTSFDDPSEKGNIVGNVDGSEVRYMGIGGVLICNGDSCGRNTDNELTGDWVFQARAGSSIDPDTRLWVKKGKVYVPRSGEPHADWGIWLTAAGTDEPGKQIEWYVAAGPAVANTSLPHLRF